MSGFDDLFGKPDKMGQPDMTTPLNLGDLFDTEPQRSTSEDAAAAQAAPVSGGQATSALASSAEATDDEIVELGDEFLTELSDVDADMASVASFMATGEFPRLATASIPPSVDNEFDTLLGADTAEHPTTAVPPPHILEDINLDGTVEAPVATALAARAVVAPPDYPVKRPRRLTQKHWIIIALVTIGILIAAIAVAFVLLQSRTSSPPAPTDAPGLAQLETAEQELLAQIAELNGDIATLTGDIAAAQASAASFTDPLDLIAVASAEDAYVAAVTAQTTFEDALAAVEVPDPVEEYERPALDTTDAAAVDAARDAVSERAAELDDIGTALELARTTLDEAGDAFSAAITTFTGTIPGYATIVSNQNPDAGADFRGAVTSTASSVATADAFTPAGLSTWASYVSAVEALRADQARAEAARPVNPAPRPNPPTTPSPGPSAPPTATPGPGTTPDPGASTPPPDDGEDDDDDNGDENDDEG